MRFPFLLLLRPHRRYISTQATQISAGFFFFYGAGDSFRPAILQVSLVFGQQCSDCEPGCKSYNTALDVLVEGGCSKVARNVFDEMLPRGVAPDVFSFSIMMKGLCNVNEVDAACGLLRGMTKYGCVPNAVVYQTLLHTLCKFDRVDEGLKLFDRMLLRGFNPNALTYGVLIHGSCRTGQVEEAKALLSKVPEPNSFMFSDSMFRNGCQPDIHTYNTLIRGLCETGRLVSARELINEMTLKGCELNTVTYTILIDVHCKEQRLEGAGEIMREMSKNGLCKTACLSMFDDAYLLLNRGVAKGFVPNGVTWYTLVSSVVMELAVWEAGVIMGRGNWNAS
ncbi:pentatricopeptide repeat-containing protein At5g64320, mitochondrial [Helianthus annuus]|uniref:pentatricopeptide repeat-containing protein At5g64320, mitochondrial n=1 Tax=Helianthus annuus TaxID=4232 RepID=UPI000B905EDC|nr:pentatricopeptide repeat-containing protein At5g64320, mitochondrial [Helianthus annuus]